MPDAASTTPTTRVLVILTSLCAEGTPVLALDLCRRWQAAGISPIVVTLSPHPGDLRSEFRAAGIPVESMKLPPTGWRRFTSLAFETYSLCRRLRPYSVLSMPLGWHAFSFLGARAAGVRNTAAHVGNYPPVHQPAVLERFRFLVQLGQTVTDALICCSSYIEAGVQEHFGIPAAKTRMIYNGVEVETFARRAARLARPDGAPFIIGMVARLEMHKDQPTLIRAAALLRDRGFHAEVWLVGEGSRREEYEALIAELGVNGMVKLLGMRRDVPELLGQMDAFVFSAKPDEGLGVALIEAMAAGVPIIATDVGACREVLKDGAFGQLVPEGDTAAMVASILQLAQRPQDRLPSVDAARRRALDVFSLDEMARRYARCLGLTGPNLDHTLASTV